jgi:hypothetical protein
VAALAGCSAAPRQPEPAVAIVSVIDRGWHTDLGLAVTDLSAPLAAVAHDFPRASYLVFGFGDRAYLLSRRQGFPEMLEALFPGPGLMLVTALRVPPSNAFGASRVVSLPLSSAGLARLTAFIWHDLVTDRNGQPLSLGYGPYRGSLYYASPTTYDAAYTCNTWTAAALRTAGLPIGAGGVLFASQVMDQVRPLAHRLQPPSGG